MRIVMIPKEGLFPNADMLHLIFASKELGNKVSLVCTDVSTIKHMVKICKDKVLDEPEYVLADSKKCKRRVRTANIILCETEKDKKELHPKKHQRVYSLESIYEKFPDSRPCFDDLGSVNKEELAKKLLADKIRRNNENLYYLRYVSQGDSEYEVSLLAVKLMELDKRLSKNEIVLFECPREFDGQINKKAFQHIKFIYWRYIPSELMGACNKLISNVSDTMCTGYEAVTRNNVIDFEDVDEVVRKLSEPNDVQQVNRTIYGIENTKLYLDYILNNF